jgi:hypothetical protein
MAGDKDKDKGKEPETPKEPETGIDTGQIPVEPDPEDVQVERNKLESTDMSTKDMKKQIEATKRGRKKKEKEPEGEEPPKEPTKEPPKEPPKEPAKEPPPPSPEYVPPDRFKGKSTKDLVDLITTSEQHTGRLQTQMDRYKTVMSPYVVFDEQGNITGYRQPGEGGQVIPAGPDGKPMYPEGQQPPPVVGVQAPAQIPDQYLDVIVNQSGLEQLGFDRQVARGLVRLALMVSIGTTTNVEQGIHKRYQPLLDKEDQALIDKNIRDFKASNPNAKDFDTYEGEVRQMIAQLPKEQKTQPVAVQNTYYYVRGKHIDDITKQQAIQIQTEKEAKEAMKEGAEVTTTGKTGVGPKPAEDMDSKELGAKLPRKQT